MFQKILVPLDGSRNAERALPWVQSYAAGSETSVVLVRALSKVYPLEGLPFGARANDAAEYLEGVRTQLLALGIPTQIQLPEQATAESIVNAAVREKCGLIVMTTRGASNVVRWLIGGVTEQVLRLSPVPVLVVRSQASPGSGQHPRRILVPQDGSVRAKRALPWALRMAIFHHVPILILHVEPEGARPPRKGSTSAAQGSRKLDQWCSLLRRRGVEASSLLCQGDPASEILRNSLPTDLVVMTTHGYGGLKHFVLGSVAEKVIHGTEAPIFILRRASSGVSGDPSSTDGAGFSPKKTRRGRIGRGP